MFDDLSFFDLFVVSLMIIVGLAATAVFRKPFGVTLKRSLTLFFWHTIFCFVYVFYVLQNGGDAVYYYQEAVQSSVDFSLGTDAVIWLTALFAKYMNFSFEGVFLIFNIIGLIGILAIDGSLKQLTSNAGNNIQRIVGGVVFLPSISFWSSAIGKDAVAFTAAAVALWASLALGRRWRPMIFSIVLMLIVRPHIAGVMVFAVALSMIFEQSISITKKIVFGALLIGMAVVFLSFVIKYVGLEEANTVSDVSDYFETRQGYNQDGAGGIDISQMSLPMQLFTYVFRPLPFEAVGFAGLFASLENVLLLFFFAYAGLCRFSNRKISKAKAQNKWFLLIFSFMVWTILAMTTANLGISLRQKWMFLPMLIYFAAAIISTANSKSRR